MNDLSRIVRIAGDIWKNRGMIKTVPMGPEHYRICPHMGDRCFNAYCRMPGCGCIFQREQRTTNMRADEVGLIAMAGVVLFAGVIVGLVVMLVWF